MEVFSRLFGNSTEYNHSSKPEKAIFTLYYLASILANVVIAYVWYSVFAAFNYPYIGIAAASFTAIVMYLAEKGMIGDNSFIGVIIRGIFIAFSITLTSVATDLSANKSDIVYKIEKDAGIENRDYQASLNSIDERYKEEEEGVLAKWLELSINGISNGKIDVVIENMRTELEAQKQISIEGAKKRFKVKNPNYNFSSILSVYLENIYYFKGRLAFYLLIIESMPLIVFCVLRVRQELFI